MRLRAPLRGTARMATSTEPSLTIVAATGLEAGAVRRAAPRLHVVESGVALSRLGAGDYGDAVVTCGLAGGLQEGTATGSIMIPDAVSTPDGEMIACDPQLSDALVTAARKLGHTPYRGSLLTSSTLVNGSARASWAQRGYVAVDMETGFVRTARIAAVRVVLDTPAHELDAAWLKPVTVLWRPWLWPQAMWLMREAPRCARLAAEVVALAFSE
jgi:phosphorylase superfamily protein